jgi:PAS domain S-box-containing protein
MCNNLLLANIDDDRDNRLLLQHCPIGLALCRMDGSLVEINPAFAAILGHTVSETLSLNYWEITSEKYRYQKQQQLESLQTTGGYGPDETEYIHKDANFIPVRLQGVIIEKDGETFIWSSVEDISAQKRSEKRFELAMRASETGLWDWNVATGEAYFSPYWCEMLGYKHEEIKPNVSNWQGLLHPDDASKVLAQLTPHLAGETPSYQVEFRMRTKEEQWQWILGSGKVVERDSQGNPLRMIGTHIDISDRKQAEKDLEKFLTLIESSSEFIGISTLEGTPIYLNNAGQRLVGIESIEQLKQKKVIEYFFLEDQGYVLEHILPLVMSQGYWEGEIRFKHFQTGEAIWVIWNLFTLKDSETGEPWALATASRDITESKKAEEELRSREQRFRAIFNSTFQFMGLLKPDGTLLDANQVALDFLSLELSSVVGRAFWETPWWEFSPVAQEQLKAAIQKAAQGEFVRYEIDVPGINHQLITFDFSIKPMFDDQNKVILLIAEGREITDRKRAERELQNYQEHLEELIADRTIELVKTNQKLQEKITELQEAQEKLRQQNQIIDQIHDSVISTDLHGIVTSWNAGAERLLGYTSQEAIGQFISFIYPPEKHEFLQTQVIPTLLAKGCYEVEITMRRQSGQNFYGHLSLSLLRDNTGGAIGLLAYAMDISDRKEAELELQRSYNLLRSVMESTVDIIFVKDLDGRYVMSNSAFSRFFNRPIDAIIGHDDTSLFPPEVVQQVRETDTRIMNQGYAETLEETVPILGKMRTYLSTKSPWRDLEGNVIGLIGMTRDMSDRKEAELELQRSYNLLRSVMESTIDMIFVKDLNGNYVMVNSELCRFFKLSMETVIGKDDTAFFPPEVARQIRENDVRIMQQGYAETLEEQVPVDGKLHTYLANKSPWRDLEGNVIGLIGMTHDITDRKEAEDILRRSEEKFRALYESTSLAVLIADEKGIVDGNPAALELFGYTHLQDFSGKYPAELSPPIQPNGEESWTLATEHINQVFQQGNHRFEWVHRRVDGTDFPSEVVMTCIKVGEENILQAVIQDLTERKEAEELLRRSTQVMRKQVQRERLFNRLANQIRNSLDLDQILETAVHAIRDLLQIDWCMFAQYEKESNPQGFHVNYESRNPDLPSVLGFYPAEMTINPLVQRLLQLETIRSDDLELFPEPDLREYWMSLGFRSVLNIPLFTDGGELAVLACYHASIRPWSDGEVDLLQGVADQITIAISQADLYNKTREAARIAQSQADRLELLNQLANQIRNSLDLNTILATTVEEIRNLLEIDWCLFGWYHFLPDNSLIWEATHEAKSSDFTKTVLASYPIPLDNVMTQELLNLQVFKFDDINNSTDQLGEMYDAFMAIGIVSNLSLPIKTISGDIGAISCNHSSPRLWTDTEIQLLKAVLDQLAIAIEQGRLYEQSRQAAIQEQAKAHQLEQTLQELKATQAQLIQSEKMSSLGQLVAGVAHEINNPVNFIYGNLSHINDYTQDLLNLLELYSEEYPQVTPAIQEEMENIELDFIVEDLPKIISSMKIGADRIREIVLSLRTFSRLDEAEMKAVNIHEGLDSTLLILQSRLKAKPDRVVITVIKEYGNLPQVDCYPGQLNQVFMNLLSNAIDALEGLIDKQKENHQTPLTNPTIWIKTKVINEDQVKISITDNGAGIPQDVISRLFDPFFTTKPVGKGTGLGLAISHSIIVEKHRGQLICNSSLNQGAEFIINIPIHQPEN